MSPGPAFASVARAGQPADRTPAPGPGPHAPERPVFERPAVRSSLVASCGAVALPGEGRAPTTPAMPAIPPPAPTASPLPLPTPAPPELSALEIAQRFPHETTIFRRGLWTDEDRRLFEGELARLGAHRTHCFNGLLTCRFAEASAARAMEAFALRHRLHRLRRGSAERANHAEVAAARARLETEREEILAWGRANGLLREVFQTYRFERKYGATSQEAHEAAARLIARRDPGVADPSNHAGVAIAWAEEQHRRWFWNGCCRHQVL